MELLTAIGVTFTLVMAFTYLGPQIVNTYYGVLVNIVEGQREVAQAKWASEQAKNRRTREATDEASA